MPVAEDFKLGAAQWVSAVNGATNIGATNSTWSSNATVTAVQNALRALPLVAGDAPDMVEKICQGLRNGVNAGVSSETHGVTTIAAALALGTAADPNVPSTYTGFLPQ